MGSLILQASPEIIGSMSTQEAAVNIVGIIAAAIVAVAALYFITKTTS